MTEFPDLLAVQAESHPQAPALIDREISLTYAELDTAVSNAARRLRESVSTDTLRVAVQAHNSRSLVMLMLAIWRDSRVVCPLNPRLPAVATAQALKRLQTTLLVSENSNAEAPAIPMSALLSDRPATHIERRQSRWPEQQLAALLFTSGSSAEPKIAALTHGNFAYNALGSNQNMPVGSDDRWLLSLPLYHVGGIGILFRTLLGGGAIVVPGRADDLIDMALDYRATHLSLVTTQLQHLLEQPSRCETLNHQLKAVLLGGSSFASTLIDRAVAAGLPLAKSYGLTEAASQVTTTAPGDSRETLGTSGHLLPHRELKITGTGEILIRGKVLFAGYWRDGDIDNARDRDGWFATGDRGMFDSEHRLIVTGRQDNMFVSGGENIQPEEIEHALIALPEIREAVVVPIEDRSYGQRPVAFVQLVEGVRLDSEHLRHALQEHLPRFKVPDHFYPWPDDLAAGDLKPARPYFCQLARHLHQRSTR